MNVTAKLRNLRKAPRKIRLIANLVCGMDATRAENELKYSVQDGAMHILKLLNSAVANAEHNFKISKDNLYISKITVDSGSILKRWMPRAFGRAAQIAKRTSHINLILSEKVESASIKEKLEAKKDNVKENKEEKLVLESGSKDKKDKKFDLKKEDNVNLKKQSKVGMKKMFRRKSI